MSDTYKGFKIPEIMPDGKLFHIICDEGVFDGYTEKAVLDHWKNKVNTLLKKEFKKQGYKERLEGLFECPSCSSLVFNPWIHENWHKKYLMT